MSVPAVVCVLVFVFVVVPAVAQFVVQLRIEAVFHEFGNRLLEQLSIPREIAQHDRSN